MGDIYIGGSGGGTWGSITGTLSDQTDLQAELDAKASDAAVQSAQTDATQALADAATAQGDIDTHTALTAEHIDWSTSGAEQVHASRYSSGTGGATNTVAGSNGLQNTGDNVNAVLEPVFGTSLNTLIHGNDARLSDARTPTQHALDGAEHTGDVTDIGGDLAGTARPPTTHALDSHSGTIADIGGVAGPPSSTDHAIARFSGSGGTTIQNTATATVTDSGTINAEGLTATAQVTAPTITASTIVEASKDIRQVEAAAPTASTVAGRGIWWVRNTNPNTPGFRDDVGDDYTLAYADNYRVENGFENQDDSVLTWLDPATPRTVQIAPAVTSFDFWAGGVKHTKSAPETFQIGTEDGLHFVYYDATGALTEIANPTEAQITDIILNQTFVVAVHWSVAQGEALLVMDERHGRVMDSRTHVYNHNTFGARYGGGLALTGIVTEGSGDIASNAQFGYDAGSIWDEDLLHSIVADAAPVTMPIFYRDGAGGAWRSESSSYVVLAGASPLAKYNLNTGGTWTQPEAQNNNYVLTHIFATGDIQTPIIGVMGQAEYSSLALAQTAAKTELHSIAFGQLEGLTPEFVAVGTVIVQTANGYGNAVGSRTRITADGADYIDWRASSGGGSMAPAAGTFQALTDTPGSYAGQAGLYPKVNATEDGLEFGNPAGGGDVLGPAISTPSAIATFNGATGKVIQDSGVLTSQLARVNGSIAYTGAMDLGGNNITNVGTVDGRSVSQDGAALDLIEPGADVTDVTNVQAALAADQAGGRSSLGLGDAATRTVGNQAAGNLPELTLEGTLPITDGVNTTTVFSDGFRSEGAAVQGIVTDNAYESHLYVDSVEAKRISNGARAGIYSTVSGPSVYIDDATYNTEYDPTGITSTSPTFTIKGVEIVGLASSVSANATALSNHEASSTAHTAANIVNVPTGTISPSSTTVQLAINELASEKSQADHTHPTLLTTDEYAAVTGATTPSAGNVFLTESDIGTVAGLNAQLTDGPLAAFDFGASLPTAAIVNRYYFRTSDNTLHRDLGEGNGWQEISGGGGSGSGALKVKCASTANVTIATGLNNDDSIDGVDLSDGDRVLLKDQTTASENGIWVVGGTPARASDFDTGATVAGELIIVKEGTVNADTFWLVTSDDGADVVGTNDLTIAQTPLAGVIDAGQLTSGTLDNARVAQSNVTQHEGALDHDNLLNVDSGIATYGQTDDRHRVILHNVAASKPAATAVPTGTYHLSTDTFSFEVSDGSAWQGLTTPAADSNAVHTNGSGEIQALTSTNATGGDYLIVESAANSYAKRKLDVAQLLGGGGGLGSFDASANSTASAADATVVHLGTLTAASVTSIRFDGTNNQGWSSLESVFPLLIGNGAVIVFQSVTDSTACAMYQSNGGTTVTGDDTIVTSVTPIDSTFTTFSGEYNVSVIPGKAISVISGSASLTLDGVGTFGERHSWPNGTSWMNWAWDNTAFGTSAPTTAVYDNTGILMPSDGAIISCWIQACAQDGTSWGFKPEITRVATTNGATSVTNTAMVSASFTGTPLADSNMEEFIISPSGTNASQLTTSTFSAGDKLILTFSELSNTGTVTSVKAEWAFKLAFV